MGLVDARVTDSHVPGLGQDCLAAVAPIPLVQVQVAGIDNVPPETLKTKPFS